MQNNIKIGKYSFYNLPQKLDYSDYKKTCDMATAKLKNNKNIKSIYLVGQKWIPGISDIDILLVYNNIIDNRIKIDFSGNLSPMAKFIFLHGYGTINEENFKNYFYIVPQKTELKLLHGEALDFNDPSKELSIADYGWLQSFMIFDFLINKLLIFPRYLRSQSVNIRTVLGEMNSFVYTAEILEKVINKKMDFNFVSQIKHLRENWFDNETNNLQKTIELFEEAINLICNIVILLNDFLEHNLDQRYKEMLKKEIIFKNINYNISFSANWNKNIFLTSFNDNYLKTKLPFSSNLIETFRIILPVNFSYFFMAYAALDGPMSDWIRRCLFRHENVEESILNDGIKKHIQAINELVGVGIKNKGAIRIPFTYGLLISGSKFKNFLKKVILFLKRIK